MSDSELMDSAIKEFKEIKEKYKTLREKGVEIRPAMLVQVDNEPSDEDRKKAWEETLALLKEKLNNASLSWVVYFGDNKDYSNVDNASVDLLKISKNDDTTDCIIFKIGPATGWDIPRACMLLRLRNVCSTALNIQTLGRIKRNPYPNLEKNAITDAYYLYESDLKHEDFTSYTYEVKEELKKIELKNITVELKEEKHSLEKERKNIGEFLNDKCEKVKRKIDTCFNKEKNKYEKKEEKLTIHNPILLLRRIELLKKALSAKENEILKLVVEDLKARLGRFNDMQIRLILLEYYTKELRELLAKSLEDAKRIYRTHTITVEPTLYQEDRSKDNKENEKEIEEDSISGYLFNILKDGKPENKLPLDSKPEIEIFDKLNSFVAENENIVTLWCKNQKSGSVFIEYYDSDFQKKKSYVDFVLKFNNGFYLYIEVKGKNDINEDKTKQLERAYREYFTNRVKQNLQEENEGGDIIIALIKASEYGIEDIRPFYDKSNQKLVEIENLGNNLRKYLRFIKDL